MSKQIPAFEDLPLRKGDPPYSAWGLWEKPELGAFNHLTDDVVLRAAKEEIQTGARISLNLPLDFLQPPLFNRKVFERQVINKAPRVINDDVISINTQSSSQWDGLRHFAYQKEGKFYNNVSQDDIHGDPNSTVNGAESWAKQGVAGRGILIDYHAWAQKNNVEYDRVSQYAIPLDHVKTIIKEEKLEPRTGDILIIRTGFTEGYTKLDAAKKEEIAGRQSYPGLTASVEVLKWLWENQFSAVAGDQPGFECIPPIDPDFGMMHPMLLSGWGTSIGELFFLEELSKMCQKFGRYSFFVSSSPLDYTGVVASPPNIMAIF
ncbi:hypothetical protein NA57DRAFT_73428 [Rhizodiscina lignyota]|uniref:Cyclase n=1 Tax=Rhizodiscina lignyota TaxID=1504668 RepID=A0A9P4IL72_9PEZI|nr:hypothetical protein NA57DRAFT_73428 [Rhizodiscina lignyota]